MFAFGRAYPPGWMEDGSPFHCTKTSWLGKDGRVLASSDFEDRQKFFASVVATGPPPLPRIGSFR